MAERRFTSWWENFSFLTRMGKTGGKSEGPSLDQVRLPTAVRSKLGMVFRQAKVIGRGSFLSSNALQGRREAAGVVGPRGGPSSQAVHRGNESGGTMVLLSGLPGTEEIKWVETSHRLISVSQLVSKSLAPVTFQIDTLVKVKKVLKPGMCATAIDLSDAYHHIPIPPKSRRYLCFKLG